MATLYVSDLDGTLLNGNKMISCKSLEIINELITKGMLFSCATARSYASSCELLKKLNLKLPYATYNGAVIVGLDGKVFESCTLDSDKIADILSAIENKGLYPLVCANVEGRERASWYAGKENPAMLSYLASRKNDARLRGVNCYEELFAGDIICISLMGSEEEMKELVPQIKDNTHISWHMQEEIYVKNEFWLEILRHDSTKKDAILKLKKLTGAERVICFGDNTNDLPMFEAADEAYAVENAVDGLKAAAGGIIGSNTDDGVARFLYDNWTGAK